MIRATSNEVSRIVECRALDGYRVELRFSDGYIGQLDLEPALTGRVFEPLRDPAFFQQVRVQDDTIRWPNEADFCPDVLRYWCQAGGVQSHEQTDAWFAAQPRQKSA